MQAITVSQFGGAEVLQVREADVPQPRSGEVLVRVLAAGLARVAAVLNRIASDAGEPARARRAGELTIAAVLSGRRAERRRRLAEPDLDFRTFCRTRQMPGSTPARMERAWDAWQAERHRRGEAGQEPACTGNPFRGRCS